MQIAGRVSNQMKASYALRRHERGLRIQVSREGAATVAVVNAPTPEIGERVAAIARGLAPYATPHESIVECVVDDPSFVWVGLPGLTREAVPIHTPGETRGPVLIRTR